MAEEQDPNNAYDERYADACAEEEQSIETRDASAGVNRHGEQYAEAEQQHRNEAAVDAEGNSYRYQDAMQRQDVGLQDPCHRHPDRLLEFATAVAAHEEQQKQQPQGPVAHALTFGTKAIALSSNKPLTSKYRGVCWNKKNKRWQAAINSSGRYLYLGSYETEEEAARMFDKAALRIRGRKARLNFSSTDYMDDDGAYIEDPDIESLLVEADHPCKGSRRGRQRGRHDEEEELDESSSPEHTSKQAKPEVTRQPVASSAHGRFLAAENTSVKSIPPSPRQGPATQLQYVPHPVQNVTQQAHAAQGNSEHSQQSLPTYKQASAYTISTSGSLQAGAQHHGTNVTRVIMPQPQQPVMIKSRQGLLQMPQGIIVQMESGHTITAVPAPNTSDSALQRQQEALDKQRSVQLMQLQHAAAVQAVRDQQQQLQQLQHIQQQQQQQLAAQRDHQQAAALQRQQEQQRLLAQSAARALGQVAELAKGPAIAHTIFDLIAKQLPDGGVLDCIIPCTAEHTMGVLFSLYGSDKMGAGLWNGRSFRSLGFYGSDKDAKQACQSALQLIKDLEPSLVSKEADANNSSRQKSPARPRATGKVAQQLQVQMVQPGGRVTPASDTSMLQSSAERVQGQKACQQPYQILLPSGVQLAPVSVDNVVAMIPPHLDNRIVADSQGGYKFEPIAVNPQWQLKLASANLAQSRGGATQVAEGSQDSRQAEPEAKRQRTQQVYQFASLPNYDVQDALQLLFPPKQPPATS